MRGQRLDWDKINFSRPTGQPDHYFWEGGVGIQKKEKKQLQKIRSY